MVAEAASDAVGAATTLTVVVEVLEVSSLAVAVMTAVWTVAGGSQLPVAALMVPALAVQVTTLVVPPVAVAEKTVGVELPAVLAGAAGVIALTATVCGVTVTEVSVESPAALVTWSQKVVGEVRAAVVIGTPVVGEVEMSPAP